MRQKILVLIFVIVLMLQGCVGGVPDTQTSSVPQTAAVDTTECSDAAAGSGTQASEKAEEDALVLPVTENTTGKTLIQTVSRSTSTPYISYIISSAKGENILLDPSEMPPKSVVDIHPAAIISTHSHSDHADYKYTSQYDCPTLLYVAGELKTNDFTVTVIPSVHSGDSIMDPLDNTIIIVEVDGLRIAHLGAIGQTVFTDEQLEKLGHIDIAFMQFENSFSDMSLSNEKGFKLIEQLDPVIVIPTHYTKKALPVLEAKYGPITEIDNCLAISKDDLPEGTLNVYRILNNHIYK